ncbi:hypothetical protein BZG02_10630 [Labilibaculum filiforme]|uniref:histidine kinase n=1 Tax=Labilibaculum filiforme TaxID=1940526 RepID=A0A2N3HYS9_9BACT|nr:tetratricopeptide repeat protein [Labilibaculum filiforme]PKQ63201.1 hypothetical protein BZG02_10630 [Labilibaculum filiforme]
MNFPLKLILFFVLLISKATFANYLEEDLKEQVKICESQKNPELYLNLSKEYHKINIDSALYFANEALRLSKLKKNYKLTILSQLELSSIHLDNGNRILSKELIDDANQIALQINDSLSISKVYYRFGSYYTTTSNYDEAIYYYNKSIDICDLIGEKETKIHNLVGIGIINWERGDLEIALNHYVDAYAIAEKIDNNNIKMTLLFNMAIIYSDEDQKEKAIAYYNHVLELANLEKRTDLLPSLYNNMAILYQNDLDYKKALVYFEKSLDIYEKMGNQSGIALVLNNIGENYFKTGDTEKAIEYLQQSLSINQQLNLETEIVYNLESLTQIYLSKGNYKEAFPYLEKGISLCEKLKIRGKKGDLLLLLGEYYNKKGDNTKAYHTILAYNSLRDSLLNESRSNKIAQLQTKFDTEKKEKENEILRVKNQFTQEKLEQEKLRTNYLFLFSFLAILVIVLIFILFRSKVKVNNRINVIVGKLEESNSKLKLMNATKDKFFSIIAHDLRSPFNAILGFSGLIKDEINTSKDIATIEEYNNAVSESAQILFTLLENLLQWANTQRGKMDFSPTSFDLHDLVQSNLNIFTLKTSDKSIKLNSDIQPNTLAYGDINMVNTIVRNLISNAIKFTPVNGEIFLSAKQEGDFIFLSVKDTGIGISKENQEKLFRIDCNYTTNGTNNEAGSGLGLILCKEFVNQNGGDIWVESEINKGSNFIFSIKSA